MGVRRVWVPNLFYERAELMTVLSAGMEVKLDCRSKSVMVGDRVVEKGNFRLGPEWSVLR